jgi:hypothetical protein
MFMPYLLSDEDYSPGMPQEDTEDNYPQQEPMPDPGFVIDDVPIDPEYDPLPEGYVPEEPPEEHPDLPLESPEQEEQESDHGIEPDGFVPDDFPDDFPDDLPSETLGNSQSRLGSNTN